MRENLGGFFFCFSFLFGEVSIVVYCNKGKGTQIHALVIYRFRVMHKNGKQKKSKSNRCVIVTLMEGIKRPPEPSYVK